MVSLIFVLQQGCLPIHYAAEMGASDIITLLLSANPTHLNIQTKKTKLSPLLIAAKKKHTTLVWQLLDSNADANLLDSVGFFYLFWGFFLFFFSFLLFYI